MKFDPSRFLNRLRSLPASRLIAALGTLVVLVTLFFVLQGGKTSSPQGLPPLKEVMEAYDGQPGLSMQHLDEYVMQGSAAMEKALPFIDDKDPKNRWMAVYVIGRVSDGETVQVLEPLLKDENESVRIAAAGTMANKGQMNALPVLIESLDSTGTIQWLHPEREIADFALEVLMVYTGQSFTNKQQWQQWWQETGSSFVWNADKRIYQ